MFHLVFFHQLALLLLLRDFELELVTREFELATRDFKL